VATYSEKLKALKDSNKYTNDFISYKTNIHSTTISKYLNGDRKLYDNDAHTLGKFFDVDVDYLFDDKIDVVDNPSEVYPYKTYEQKMHENEESIKLLKLNLESYETCDKYFKEDVLSAIDSYNKTFNEMRTLLKETESDFKERNVIGILNQSYSDLVYFQYIQRMRMNENLRKIEEFIRIKDGAKLYSASKALFDLKNQIDEVKKMMKLSKEFVDEILSFVNEFNKIINEDEKLNELLEKVNINCEMIFNMFENDDFSLGYLLKQRPKFDVDAVFAVLLVSKYKNYYYYIDKSFGIKLNDYENFLKNILIEVAYDLTDNNQLSYDNFIYDSDEYTTEKIYRYFMDSLFEEMNLHKEVEEYKRKAIEWLEIVERNRG
jgi:transcriptional regulator with XRE-family HTH domain